MNNIIVDEKEKLNTPIVYEVIRIIDEKPLFLKDHLIRLENSIIHFSKNKLNIIKLKKEIYNVIKRNNIINQNIRIEIGNFTDKGFSYKVFPILSNYPSSQVYSIGVNVITIHEGRKSPEIKIRNDEFKKHIKDELNKKNSYEAILIDDNNKILEGSRSNLFFVKGNKVITSKVGDVLEGVTLKNVIKLIKNEKFDIIRRDIYLEELPDFNGAFLTGTSIDILPIELIDTIIINSSRNPVISKLMDKFKNMKQDDIRGDI